MKRILYIDDDREMRNIVQDALRGVCDVVVAETGEEGIALAKQHNPSLILIDINLPGLSGYDVLMKLREREGLKEIPILATTGDDRIGKSDISKGLGFDDYLVKPIQLKNLRELIKHYLSGRAAIPEKQIVPSALKDYTHDLIDRLQSKIEDLNSQKRFTESILQSLSSGLMVLSPDERIITVNQGGKEILQVFADTIEGRKLSHIIGSKGARIVTEIKKETLFYRNEIALPARNGEERIIGFTTVPQFNADGVTVGLIISFRDITDIHNTQKEMERVSRLSTLAEIASAVAHEIRNPLAGIKTMAQSIDENLSSADENKEYVRRIIKQVDRLDELLREFFVFARPPQPKIGKASLIAIMKEVKELVKRRLDEQKVVLKEHYEKGLPHLLVDADQIQQVFLNLMLNALDTLKSKGVIEITARRAAQAEQDAYSAVLSTFGDKASRVIVEFRDNGPGVKKELAGKIFEPFFTTKTTGTGLGLAVVHRILRENNAAIFLRSEEGGGTTFAVFFPADPTWEKSLS